MKKTNILLLLIVVISLTWNCTNSKHKTVKNDSNSYKEIVQKFGISIDSLDGNYINAIIHKDTLQLTNQLHETILGKQLRFLELKPKTVMIKFEFGFNQYTIDDSPAQSLDYSKLTSWYDLNSNTSKVAIPVLNNNAQKLSVIKLMKLQGAAALRDWLAKDNTNEIKAQSLQMQEIIYNKILANKAKYAQCCTEYITQAKLFHDTKNTIEFKDLGLELIIKKVFIQFVILPK